MIAVKLARKTGFDQRCVPKYLSSEKKNQQDFWKKLNCEENGYW
jgi:hypothetical protein